MYEYKANYNDLISDFNLYLCERFGYRNACSVMWNTNGICISIHKGSLDFYIHFWEYSKGVGNYPDWCIISPVASSAMNCESTASNSSKTLYDSSRSICPTTGINTYAPRMTTTSITRHSTSPASNAALWDAIATMEHH